MLWGSWVAPLVKFVTLDVRSGRDLRSWSQGRGTVPHVGALHSAWVHLRVPPSVLTLPKESEEGERKGRAGWGGELRD